MIIKKKSFRNYITELLGSNPSLALLQSPRLLEVAVSDRIPSTDRIKLFNHLLYVGLAEVGNIGCSRTGAFVVRIDFIYLRLYDC